jgi:hypothetical protein
LAQTTDVSSVRGARRGRAERDARHKGKPGRSCESHKPGCAAAPTSDLPISSTRCLGSPGRQVRLWLADDELPFKSPAVAAVVAVCPGLRCSSSARSCARQARPCVRCRR